MNIDLRQLRLPLAVLAAVGLTACGSSSKDTAAPQQATTTTSAASTPSPTPTPSPSGLSKAEFVAKMDAVCVDTNTKLQRLEPKDAQDLAGLVASAEGTLKLYPAYIKQADALVGQSADKATLTTHWLSVEKSDFAVLGPALKKFVADVRAKDQAAVAADGDALDKAPDHSEQIAKFMSGYGLKSCAILQRS